MARTWKNAPSPCIDVCKYRAYGQCIGCGMTKPEKRKFKTMKGKAGKKPFLLELLSRLKERPQALAIWKTVYRRKCRKKGVPCPLDKLEAGEDEAA